MGLSSKAHDRRWFCGRGDYGSRGGRLGLSGRDANDLRRWNRLCRDGYGFGRRDTDDLGCLGSRGTNADDLGLLWGYDWCWSFDDGGDYLWVCGCDADNLRRNRPIASTDADHLRRLGLDDFGNDNWCWPGRGDTNDLRGRGARATANANDLRGLRERWLNWGGRLLNWVGRSNANDLGTRARHAGAGARARAKPNDLRPF